MKYQKIYPKDWANQHPYQHPDEVDKYYANVANKVSQLILNSQLYSHDMLGDIAPLSMYLTLWFEDIISGTNIWKTVNNVCMQRYGSKLPFYDTTMYYDDEPNEQDIRLLLWHYLQTFHENSQVFNPENSAIGELAKLLCDYFDECYPEAPANERLAEYYFNPIIAHDYWACRKVVEWFALHSYIMVTGIEELFYEAQETVQRSINHLDIQQVMYSMHMEKAYKKQRTLLSLTPAEWLWHMRECQDEGLANMKLSDTRYLEVINKDSQSLYVKDLVSDESFAINVDSWTADAEIVRMSKKGLGFVATTMSFGKEIYQCGLLAIPPKMDVERIQQIRLNNEFNQKVYQRFMKLSNKECLIFYCNLDEFKKIISKLGIPDKFTSPLDFIDKGAISCSTTDGIFIVRDVECLKTMLNPHYNEKSAKEHGHMFMTAPDTAPYELTCAIQEAGWLEDAALASLKGEEYGRKFLQTHGQFITDYFFAQHK